MKPTVIASANQQGDNNPTPVNNNPPNSSSSNFPSETSARDFPHFQSGFGFRPHFDNMFDDDDFGPQLRARMRDPFGGFGGRFHDPEWEAMRGSRRRAPQAAQRGSSGSGGTIFDHIPAQFRSYFGEPEEYSSSYPPQQQHHQPQQQPPQQQYYQQPQQQYYPEQQPAQQYYQQPQQQAPRPKYCDASIQTENNLDCPDGQIDPNLNQHNLRNTVDLGQKSQQEGVFEPRSHSAPPTEDPNQNYAAASASAYAGPGVNQQAAYSSTGTDPRSPQQGAPQQPGFAQQRSHPSNPPPPPQRQHFPHPQYQHPQYAQQQVPQQQAPPQETGGFVRTVPIFVEGRSEPVNTPPAQRRRMPQQQQQAPPPQQQYQQKPQQYQQQPQQYQQQPQQQQHRPTPLNTQQAPNQVPQPSDQGQVPQTPQTAACINKIQDIQRDVLNLMGEVEQFAGTKNDKDYLYLDEMLTRNLLKLDIIDTDGKDSIRLARREAIKCIQASINVLEAKAEENAKTAQKAVMPGDDGTESAPAAEAGQTVGEQPKDGPIENPEASNVNEAQNPLDTQTEDGNSAEVANETIAPESQASTEAEQPASEENLDAPKESIEKSSSEKENKPPGSPKKKLVRKVKKKVPTPPGTGTPDESAIPPPAETADNSEAKTETVATDDNNETAKQ